MLQRIDQLIAAKESFAIETTLTTISYLKTIQIAKAIGYEIILFYVWLNSQLAIERVSQRVKKGGHNIPAEIIERRYFKALQNLPKFIEFVDGWYFFDNSGSSYEEIAKMVMGKKEINNFELFSKMMFYDQK